MEYYALIAFLLLLSLGAFSIGIYMIYSGIFKKKGVKLPKKNYLPFFVNLKEGQEWILVLGGVGWTLGGGVMLLASLAALLEFILL